jgi:hypothetical protein
MALVNQKSPLPTRKLTAAMLATAIAATVKAAVVSRWPDFADPLIWEPLPIIIGLVAGYFVRDTANT